MQINPEIAQGNKTYGYRSLWSGIGSTAIGIANTFVSDDYKHKRFLEFSEKVLEATRFNQQYSMYARPDDDLGFDIKTRPHAGNIGELACWMEKYVNPVIEPVSALLDKNKKGAIADMAHYLSSLWWRIRLYSDKIVWKDFKKLPELFKQLFKKEKLKLASIRIRNIITPFLGLIGFGFIGLFQPIQAWNKLTNADNHIINALAHIGQSTQHLAYFFRFSLPQLIDKNKKMFALGAAGNIMNIALPIIDVLQKNNNFLTIYKKLASGLTMTFFSSRRILIGENSLNEVGQSL